MLPRRGTESTLSSATAGEAWDSPPVPMTLGSAPLPVSGVEKQEVRSKGVTSLTPPLHDRQVDEPQAYNLDVFHKSFFQE